MSTFKPFKAVRPKPELAEKISSLPYDVMNRAEAKKMAESNPYSFLHITRSEIDLDESVDAYDESVYLKANDNLNRFVSDGIMVQDNTPRYYIYRQIMQGRAQTGIVGCASVDEYLNDAIKKHELTREEKEIDRIKNFDYCSAHTEPVFLTYKKSDSINKAVASWIENNSPLYEFQSEDGISHILWAITDDQINKSIENEFSKLESLYIADGHHRSASSVKVGLKRRENSESFTGNEEFNYFMTVAFPDDDLFIMDYNRVVKDLNGLTEAEFLEKLREKFIVSVSDKSYKPAEKHTFGMYLNNRWYKLTAKQGAFDPESIIDSLDVSILQNNVLSPLLGIENPKKDKRIDFIGGIRGLSELERRCAADMAVAFSMFPVMIGDLFRIADAGMIMPPKSTWFEPKLRSGLFVHRF